MYKQCPEQNNYYITDGIMAGTTEKPTILLNKGNTEKLMDNKEIILF